QCREHTSAHDERPSKRFAIGGRVLRPSGGITIAQRVTAVPDELVAASPSVWRRDAEIPLAVPRRARALVLRPRVIRYISIVLLLAYPSAWVARLTARKYYVFTASYIRWAMTPP